MDYFAKFRKRISPPKTQPTSAMRLAKFHKCWDYVHNIFIAEDRKSNLHVKQTEIPEKLREMVDMLVDEEARQEDNTTDVCMEYFLKHGVLQYLVNQSEKMDYPEGIRGESIRMIANMVDLLDDRFLVHNAVHRPTIKLLRFCVLDARQSEVDHEDLVDLMYIICSKIHGLPDLLNIFFHDKQWLTHPEKMLKPIPRSPPTISVLSQQQSSSPPEYEFLLFTYLLRFVHREGRAGDFARTGLLFLMEMATDQLGDFILDSDFATVMAASLGALFCQLPRKLIIKDEVEINSTPASFLLGQDLDPKSYPTDEFGIEQSNSGQFKYQLDSFLKLLEFCQDVLLRCPNHAISDRLLLCIRKSFLENVLYPSIVECSDYDGSSVAVISYIDLILQTVQQRNLANVIVGFLMDHYDNDQCNEIEVQGLEMSSPTDQQSEQDQNPYFTHTSERFTLKDLVFSRLKSTSQVTVIATLKLLKTLITKHCHFADRLLSMAPDKNSEQEPPATIISHHIREIELYFNLISAIDSTHADDILNLGYEDYLKDVEAMLDVDPCYHDLIQSPYHQHKERQREQKEKEQQQKSERRRSFKYGQKKDFMATEAPVEEPDRHKHKIRQRIKSTDTLIPILLGLLSHFFAQSSELNLALTGVISALAMCPYRSLEGWISFSEQDRTNSNDIIHLTSGGQQQQQQNTLATGINKDTVYEEQDFEDDQSLDFGAEKNSVNMTAPTQFKSFPPFYTIFRTLTQQVDYYRSEVEGFDKLLDERWNGLLFGEPTTSNMNNMGIQVVPSSSTHSLRRGSNATSIFDPHSMMKPSTSTSTINTSLNTTNTTASVVSQGVSKFFGLASSSTTTTSTHKRRNSVVSLKPSISTSTLNPNNPVKSMSSSTSHASLQQVQQQQQPVSSTPYTQPIIPVINPLSPLAMHAKKTLSIRIQPLFPSNFETDRDEPILNLDEEDQDVFAPQQNPSQRKRKNKSTEISLSMLLNNVVILEETIKEIVAILQVRRSLGIDKIRYT